MKKHRFHSRCFRLRAARFLAQLSLLTALLPACGSDPGQPGSVLLITVDTLRADFVGAYSPESSRTPRLDQLAREGTVFENAVAPMPLTRPSHFSILTSLYPREHGVLNNAISLPDSAVTLAEVYREQGFRTAAFVSIVLLDEESGAAQGFDEFHHPTDPREQAAAKTVAEALEWIGALRADQPFFVWIHLFDPHLPYGPPTPYGRDLDTELATRLPAVNWPDLYAVARRNGGDIPKAILDHAVRLYRGEVEYTDHWVGELLDGLETRGRRTDTVVAFTADHGEAFEKGVYFEHADSLFDGAIHVPLIISYPPQFPSGARVSTQVSLIDIAPTLLRATGIEPDPSYSGLPLQDAESFGDRYVLIQHPFYQPSRARNRPRKQSVIRSVAGDPVTRILVESERVGLVGTEWKLLRTEGARELYRRSGDGERTDFAAQEESVRAKLDSALTRELKEHPLHLIDVGEINPELLETLKALGYVE